MPRIGIQPIISILLIQLLVSLILASVLALSQQGVAAVSALLGGAVAVVPNAFLAARLLSPKAGVSAEALLKAAWLGELGKLVLTAALFAAVFVAVRPISPLALFGGFIAAQLVVIGMPLIRSGRFEEDDGKTKS